MARLKGVLVDFGDTLAYVDREGDERYSEELASILVEHGCEKTLDELRTILYDTYGDSTKGEMRDIYELWQLFLLRLGVPEDPMLVRELEELRNRHASTVFRLYEGAEEVLCSLKRKYKLALVSSCAIGLSDVLNALGLTRFFECIILSYQVGVRKPNRRIYLEALRRLKLGPEGCAFVSDEISDLEGAREVGLRTVLVRQGDHTVSEAKDPDFRPDFICNSITEVPGLF